MPSSSQNYNGLGDKNERRIPKKKNKIAKNLITSVGAFCERPRANTVRPYRIIGKLPCVKSPLRYLAPSYPSLPHTIPNNSPTTHFLCTCFGRQIKYRRLVVCLHIDESSVFYLGETKSRTSERAKKVDILALHKYRFKVFGVSRTFFQKGSDGSRAEPLHSSEPSPCIFKIELLQRVNTIKYLRIQMSFRNNEPQAQDISSEDHQQKRSFHLLQIQCDP